MLRPLLAAVLLTALTPLAQAQPDEAPDEALAQHVARFLAADSDADRARTIAAIAARKPSTAAVAALLRKGRSYPDAAPGWTIEKVKGRDGVSRSYHLFVPLRYDSSKPTPVLFDLHGGVSRPQPMDDDGMTQRRKLWQDAADRAGMILISPTASKGAEWWSPVGSDSLLRALAAVKRQLNVDEDRVYLTGFSDGGSGSFYMALFHPTRFAAAAPLSGHVAVAQAGQKPVYLPVLRHTPCYIVNGTRDPLYPAAKVTPYVDAMRKAGAEVVYQIRDAGHDMSYLQAEQPKIVAFLTEHPRTPYPDRISLETAVRGQRCHGLVVEQLGRVRGETRMADINLTVEPRLQLGIRIDADHDGDGLKISSVAKDTLAAQMDLRKGDVLLAADGKALGQGRAALDVLRGVLGGKSWGDQLALTSKRGEVTFKLTGSFVEPAPKQAFDRRRRAGRVDLARDGNLIIAKTRGVRRFSLLLPAGEWDPSKPITVQLNGRDLPPRTVEADVRLMLQQAARDDDRRMIYSGKLTIDVRAAMAGAAKAGAGEKAGAKEKGAKEKGAKEKGAEKAGGKEKAADAAQRAADAAAREKARRREIEARLRKLREAREELERRQKEQKERQKQQQGK